MAQVRGDPQRAHEPVQESVSAVFGAVHPELTDLVRNDATKCAEFVQKYIDLQFRHGDRKEVSNLVAYC